MTVAPTKKIITCKGCAELMWPASKSRYPTMKLNIAHNTFTVGDDKPLPGGFEKGEGNLLPEMPCVKWGIAFAKKAPAKKAAGNYTNPYLQLLYFTRS